MGQIRMIHAAAVLNMVGSLDGKTSGLDPSYTDEAGGCRPAAQFHNRRGKDLNPVQAWQRSPTKGANRV